MGGLRALSLMMGVFLVFMGIGKIDWLTDTTALAGLFQEWLETAPAASRWYLQTIAIPGVPVFARVVPLAEMASGAALVCGFKIRLAAALALLMVLNFHFASDVLLHYSYLTNPYGLPVLGGLLALAIGGGKLPFSVRNWPTFRSARQTKAGGRACPSWSSGSARSIPTARSRSAGAR